MNTSSKPRMIVGISGASGIVYGVRILALLKDMNIETHLVVSQAGRLTAHYELGFSSNELNALADYSYGAGDVGAAISSGSFKTLGMIVAPCSMRSLSEISGGVTTGLLSRAADVVLKERRRLVLMVRETPLHTGHLRSMTAASEMGAIIYPPVPAFYSKPSSIEDIVTQTAGRVLDLFDLDAPVTKRWGEDID